MNSPESPAMTAQQSEDEDARRLRKADECIAYYAEREKEAGRALVEARELKKRALEKRAAMFLECEKRACGRRDAGLIVNRVD